MNSQPYQTTKRHPAKQFASRPTRKYRHIDDDTRQWRQESKRWSIHVWWRNSWYERSKLRITLTCMGKYLYMLYINSWLWIVGLWIITTTSWYLLTTLI